MQDKGQKLKDKERIESRIRSINDTILRLLNERYDLEEELDILNYEVFAKIDKRKPSEIPIDEVTELLPFYMQDKAKKIFGEYHISNIQDFLDKSFIRQKISTSIYNKIIYVLTKRYNIKKPLRKNE